MRESSNGSTAELSDEDIRVVAAAAGRDIPPARLPDFAAKVRELGVMTRDFDVLDLSGVAPETVFDPGWEQER